MGATMYCIDFAIEDKIVTLNRLEVLEYDKETLEKEMVEFGVKNALELTDYDRVLFLTEQEALEFLENYKKIYNKLDNNWLCKNKKLPSLAYRRRHIIFGLMGVKLVTQRNYKKNWQPGQLFNLHDRTYFWTVELIKIVKADNNCWDYYFKGV